MRRVVDRIVTDSLGTATPFGVSIGDSLEKAIERLGKKPRDWKEGADKLHLVTCPEDSKWVHEDYVTFRFDSKRTWSASPLKRTGPEVEDPW